MSLSIKTRNNRVYESTDVSSMLTIKKACNRYCNTYHSKVEDCYSRYGFIEQGIGGGDK